MIEIGNYDMRNGDTAVIERVGALVASGHIKGTGGRADAKEVWRASDGHWSLNGNQEHAWDLVRPELEPEVVE